MRFSTELRLLLGVCVAVRVVLVAVPSRAREEQHQGSAGMACAQPSPAAGDRGVRSDDATVPVAQFAGQAK